MPRLLLPSALTALAASVFAPTAPAQMGPTTLTSQDSGGVSGNAPTRYVSISPDGRLVSFESDAWSLVSGDTNFATDAFLHDRVLGTTVFERQQREVCFEGRIRRSG